MNKIDKERLEHDAYELKALILASDKDMQFHTIVHAILLLSLLTFKYKRLYGKSKSGDHLGVSKFDNDKFLALYNKIARDQRLTTKDITVCEQMLPKYAKQLAEYWDTHMNTGTYHDTMIAYVDKYKPSKRNANESLINKHMKLQENLRISENVIIPAGTELQFSDGKTYYKGVPVLESKIPTGMKVTLKAPDTRMKYIKSGIVNATV
jgi:hypothetical protein